MKIKLFILAVSLYSFSACEGKPHADFSTDKTQYSANEIVNLTNKSWDATSYEWEMPNGDKIKTENARFTIDPKEGFTELSFKLTAKSKGHIKKSTITKSINVIPMSYCAGHNIPYNTFGTYVLTSVNVSQTDSNYIVVGKQTRGTPYDDETTFTIYFPPGLPAAGQYLLQSSKNPLPANGAFFSQSNYVPDLGTSSKDYVTGQIQVDYTHNMMHVYFSDIGTSPVYFTLSGDMFTYY